MKFDFITNTFTGTDKDTGKLAISGSDKDVSWKELYENVCLLEDLYKSLGIPKGHPVMIYGHKESLYAQVILSLMKSDIPYVPVDEIYPVERIEKIKNITGCRILINCSGKDTGVEFPIEINSRFQVFRKKKPVYENNVFYNPENPLRYIMFTSGSTGEPKGVQITKNNILSFLEWIEKDYNYSAGDVFMNQSPFTFDVSLYDILSSFMLGASVLLISRKLASDNDKFLEKLKSYNVSVWTSTPSFAYIYLRDKTFHSGYLPSLKTFVFAGEVLSAKIVEALHKKFENPRIINAYGPTEATITTTWIEITSGLLKTITKMPVGYPKRDSIILIENKENDPAKEGEIIIVGDHVSPGYFKNENLTKSKFFKHHNKQAFNTGDLGFIKNNVVYFTGRNDDLIKFHGYRIELGEIDTAIIKVDFVDEAVTIALKRNDEVKRIISFVILKAEIANYKRLIISNIENKLPSYMIPGDIVAIKEFPVNANHKTDKQELIKIYSRL